MSIEDGIDIRILIDVDINIGLDPDYPNQGIEEISLAAHGIEAIADDIDLVQGIEEEGIDLDLETEDIDIMIKFLFYFYFYFLFFILFYFILFLFFIFLFFFFFFFFFFIFFIFFFFIFFIFFFFFFFFFFSFFFNKIIKFKFIFKYIKTNYRNLKKFKNSEIFLKLKDNTNVLNTIYDITVLTIY